MHKAIKLVLILAGIILLSLIDLGANLLSLIPYIGSAFESMTEIALEMLQILLVVFGFIVAGSDKE